MRSKIGPFWLAKSYNVSYIAGSYPAIVKSSHLTHLRDLYERVGETCTYIARHYGAGEDFVTFEGGLALRDPEQAAFKWWQYSKREISAYRKYGFYFESFNEVYKDVLLAYGRFEAERQRIMYEEGFRACVGNFSVGNPDVSDQDGDGREDYWPLFYSALENAHRYRNILGLHEYGGLWMSLWFGDENQHDPVVQRGYCTFPETYQEGWLFGRYRKVWRRHILPNNWTNIRVALTEFGLDHAGEYTVDRLTGGKYLSHWRSCQPWWNTINGRSDGASYYLEQLAWSDRQMQQDSYVVGATVFPWGVDEGSVWSDYDVMGPVGNALLLRMRTSLMTVKPEAGLNLRLRPDGVILAALPQNMTVVVEDKDIDGWFRVQTPRGLSGWVKAEYLV